MEHSWFSFTQVALSMNKGGCFAVTSAADFTTVTNQAKSDALPTFAQTDVLSNIVRLDIICVFVL